MNVVQDNISNHSAGLVGPARRFTAWTVVGLGLVVSLALYLRFSGIEQREPWLDENCTFFLMDEFPSWGAVGRRWPNEVAHLPYVGLLKLWSFATGASMWHLRAWSALAGTATVLVVAGLAAALAGRRAAFVAALLLAVHPLHIHYSQEARVYATWMLAIACCMVALLRAARSGRAGWWIAYAALALMTVLVHYHTLFWLPVTISAVVISTSRREFLRRWFITHLALLPGLAAIVWCLVVPLGGSGPRWWLLSEWNDDHPARVLARSLWAMLPSGGYPNYLGALTFVEHKSGDVLGAPAAIFVRWAPCVVGLVVVVWSFFARAARHQEKPGDHDRSENLEDRERRALLWLVGLGVGYLLAIWVYSYFVDPAYVVARYDLAALPALTLALGIAVSGLFDRLGMGRSAGQVLGIIATGVLCLCSLATVHVARLAPVSSDMTIRAQRIAATVGPSDLVISLNGYRWFMDYAWKKEGIQAEIRSFPPWHDGQLCWDNPEAELRDPGRIASGVAETIGAMQAAIKSDRRVWLLGQPDLDSLRWEVDRRLFEALGAEGLGVSQVDEWVGLARIKREVEAETP